MLEIEKRQQIAESQGGRDIACNPMRALEPPEAKLKRVFNDAVAQCEESCWIPPPPGAKARGSTYKGSFASSKAGQGAWFTGLGRLSLRL